MASVLCGGPALGCGGDDGDGGESGESSTTTGESGPAEPHAKLAATVDLLDLCGTIGATHVFLRAQRVGCIGSPPAPCTLPTAPYELWVGDTVACPNAATDARMAVAVTKDGKFWVEAVTLTESGEVALCYRRDGESPVEVLAAEIDGGAEIAVARGGGPCG